MKVNVVLRNGFSHVIDGKRVVGEDKKVAVELDQQEYKDNEHKFELAAESDDGSVNDLSKMKVAELVALANEKGLEVPEKATKAQLLEILKAAE